MSTPQRPGLFGWLDERFNLSPIFDYMRHKEVPIGTHSLVWYYLGGTTLFFFCVQVATGALLLAYYQPGLMTSYESIRFITTKVPFGWLIRSMHCWSAHLMIIFSVTHMFSTMLLKAYRPPRELTWVTGFLLLAIALGFGFSGYLLPWNELAFFATSVGTDSVKAVPFVGEWILTVLRGGSDVTINTLYRFFALHVVILPLSIVMVLCAHLLFIQRQGMAPPVGHDKSPRGMRFFPDFMLRDLLLWLILLIVLVSVAVFLPYGPGVPGVAWELGKKADALAPAYPGIKPEWYFLWIYQLLKEFPAHLLFVEGPQAALAVVGVMMGAWLLMPWIDGKARQNIDSPQCTDLGVAALLFLGFLTLKAWDIGAGLDPLSPEGGRHIAATCAWIIVGLAAVVAVVRRFYFREQWFLWSAAVVLHAVLHGFAGLSYLAAGAVALVAAGAAIAVLRLRGKTAASGGAR